MLSVMEKSALSTRLAHHLDNNALQTILFELSIDVGSVAHCTSLQLAQLLVRHADNQGRVNEALAYARELRPQVPDWFAPLSPEEVEQSPIAQFINHGVVMMSVDKSNNTTTIDNSVHTTTDNSTHTTTTDNRNNSISFGAGATVGAFTTGDNSSISIGTQNIGAIPNADADAKQQLAALVEELNAALKSAAPDDAEVIKEETETLLKKAEEQKPRKSLEISAKGVMEAAQAVGSVVPIAEKIIKMVLGLAV